MEILIHRDGQDLGPYSPREIRDRIASGQLTREDLAWYEGLPAWVPLGDLRLPPEEEAALVVVQKPTLPAVVATQAVVPAPIMVPAPGRKCPFCAEPIQLEAMKCRHCGEILDPRMRAVAESKRAAETARQTAAQHPLPSNNVNVKVNTAPHTVVVHRQGTSCVTWGCLLLFVGVFLLWLIGALAH